METRSLTLNVFVLMQIIMLEGQNDAGVLTSYHLCGPNLDQPHIQRLFAFWGKLTLVPIGASFLGETTAAQI